MAVLLELVWLGDPWANVRTSDTLALGSTRKMIVMLGSDTLRRVNAIVSFSSTTVLYVMGKAFARGMKIYGKKQSKCILLQSYERVAFTKRDQITSILLFRLFNFISVTPLLNTRLQSIPEMLSLDRWGSDENVAIWEERNVPINFGTGRVKPCKTHLNGDSVVTSNLRSHWFIRG